MIGRHADAVLPKEARPSGEPTEDSALPAVLTQPFHGTRGTAPGPRGCWAINKAGLPCASPRRGDSEFCNSHSGIGVAADPKGHAAKGVRASIESRRRRADLRFIIGTTRLDSPRAALRAAVLVEAERLGGRAVSAALDPSLAPKDAVSSVLALVDAVDPRTTATAVVTHEIDPSTASLSQLLSFAEAHGIEPAASVDAEQEAMPSPSQPTAD